MSENNNDYTDPTPAFSDEKSVESLNPWEMLADQQRADMETAQINANQKRFDDIMAIEAGSKRKIALAEHDKQISGAAAVMSAFSNGGLSDRSLSDTLSKAFGKPIFGGQLVSLEEQGTGFVLYGAGKGKDGNATVVPVAMMDNSQVLKMLQGANLGDRTMPLQERLYGELSSKFTPQQIESAGISRPNAPISTGTTVISGAGMRALRGTPQAPSRISFFASDGKGGFSRGAFDRKTGEDWTVDYGTRDPERQGKWKVLSSGPDGKRYENDKTGETVGVPEGKNLGDVLAARQHKPSDGLTFDERRQLQQEVEAAKNERAKLAQQSRKETEEERTKRHREGRVSAWDNTRYAAIEKRLDQMRRAKIKGIGGSETPRYTLEQIAEKESQLYAQMDADRAKAFPELYETRARTEQAGKTGGSTRQAPPSSGDNGNRQFKKGDVHEVNGVRMMLLPSKKNPGKLTWQRV